MNKILECNAQDLLNREVQRFVKEANDKIIDLGFLVKLTGVVIEVAYSRFLYKHSQRIPPYWKDLNFPLKNAVNEVIALSIKFITLQLLNH